MLGYKDPLYAQSLQEFGKPHYLANSQGWILERKISHSDDVDGMGCYPLFVCEDWSKLSLDMISLENKLVSLALVTDPFGKFNENELRSVFDVCYLYKQHYITDFSVPIDNFVRKRSKKYAIKALETITIEYCTEPIKYYQEWIDLYSHLIKRHNLSGIRAFSNPSFKQQLEIPGMEMFVAKHKGTIIGADLWMTDGNTAYAHLSAIHPIGYELRATYALYWSALLQYAKNLRFLHHGGGAGVNPNEDGLAIFKKGWANDTLPVYFCGKILDGDKYQHHIKRMKNKSIDYFPKYRYGEFR